MKKSTDWLDRLFIGLTVGGIVTLIGLCMVLKDPANGMRDFYNIFIPVITVVAALLTVFCGFQLFFSKDEEAPRTVRRILLRVIGGLVLAYSGYLFGYFLG